MLRKIPRWDLNLAPGLGNILPVEVLLSPEDTRFFRTLTTTGASSVLYLGYNQGYYSNILLKFYPFAAALPDSFTVDSLRVKLIVDSVALSPGGDMAASAFLVNRERSWYEIGVTWNTFNPDTTQMGASFAAIQIPAVAADSDSVFFSLPSPDSLLRSWVAADSGDTAIHFNNGIYLAASTNQNYMMRFTSSEYTYFTQRPRLEMFLKDYDTTVTHGGDPVDSVFYSSPIGDAFIALDSTTLSPQDSARVWLGNAAAYRTIMRFPIDATFDTISHYNVAVQRAELIIHYDSTSTLNFDQVSGAYGIPMADTTWLQTPATAPTLAVSLPGLSPYDPATGTLAVNVTLLVNDWIQHRGNSLRYPDPFRR